MLLTKTGRLTRSELERLTAATAARLSAAGVRCGEPVLLCLPNGARWIAHYLAIGRIGAVCVPMNAASAAEEVAHVLTDCGARFADRVLWWPDGRAADSRVGGHPRTVLPESAATIAYTSGTTGRPKGVLQTRRAVVLGGESPAERLSLGPGDVVATALPLAHSYGTNVLNAVLAAGAALALLDRFDTEQMLDLARRCGATVLAGVPTTHRRLLEHPERPSGVRCVLSAGQAAGADLASRWEERIGGAFVEGWGMTELAGFAALASPRLADRHGTAGTAAPGVRLRLVAPDRHGTGELHISGPMVTPGYLHGSAPPLTADGWLRTGDIGTIDTDGRVRIGGRSGEVVVSGGFNIHPAEVERIMATHPAVREVAVTGAPDPERGEVVCAWVVLAPGARVSARQLLAHCRPHLAGYKLPRLIMELPELPLTDNGKVSRRQLTALLPEADRITMS